MDRRTALRWTAAVAVAGGASVGTWHVLMRGDKEASSPAMVNAGYGKDPPLVTPRRDAWPLLLGDRRRAAAGALADVFLPGDPAAKPPAPPASHIDIADFFDEWLSAPYPQQRADRDVLLPLLDALAPAPGYAAIVRRRAEFRAASTRFRVLCVAAYYTSQEGLAAIGFVGNEARDRFDGPPAELVERFEAALRDIAMPDRTFGG